MRTSIYFLFTHLIPTNPLPLLSITLAAQVSAYTNLVSNRVATHSVFFIRMFLLSLLIKDFPSFPSQLKHFCFRVDFSTHVHRLSSS
jgi:hypothetical protein